MEARGKTLLKITGVLLVIGGILNILVGILGFLGGGGTAILGSSVDGVSADQAAAIGGLLIGYALVCTVYGITALLAGINGVKHAGEVSYAGKCFKFGIAIVVIQIFVAVISILTRQFSVSTITGFILPVVYMIAANMNKNSIEK